MTRDWWAPQSVLVQIIGVPHAALLSVIFGLFLASFPMGAYVVFASDIGGEINYDFPLFHLEIFEGTDLYGIDAPFSLGDAFVVIWILYIIIFMVAALGPLRGFGSVISDVMAGKRVNYHENSMLGSIVWFSVLVFVSVVIITAQDAVDIPTVPPDTENLLAEFFYVTLAPLVEETGFRLLLVGIPVFLLYSSKMSPAYFARCMWSPSTLAITDARRAFAVVLAVGIVFGFMHIALGQPWSEGKFAQAAAGGIILGWAYLRYGFAASIVIHWAANYFVFAHAHFVSQTHVIHIDDAFSHTMIFSIQFILVACGALSVAAMYASRRIDRRANQVQGSL